MSGEQSHTSGAGVQASLTSGSTYRVLGGFMSPDITGPLPARRLASCPPTDPALRKPGASLASWPLCVFTEYVLCTKHSTSLRWKTALHLLSRCYFSETFGERRDVQNF